MNIQSASSTKGDITLSAESFNTDTQHKVAPVQQSFHIRPGDNAIEISSHGMSSILHCIN